MITRKEYMDSRLDLTDGSLSEIRGENSRLHDEYYLQFVDSGVKARVICEIGLETLKASRDSAFNDIPMNRPFRQNQSGCWDQTMSPFPRHIADKMRECGDYPTLAGAVCIAKRAARELIK